MLNANQSRKPRIVIAAGGTGGHIFPAQALARELKQEADLLFVGGQLENNRFFNPTIFPWESIATAPLKNLSSLFVLTKGIGQSYRLLRRFDPNLLIGFGSFHTFPILSAALLRKVPFILFEPNLYPGRVNRLFGRFALWLGSPFLETKTFLKGPFKHVRIPLWHNSLESSNTFSKEKELKALNLHPSCMTLLVFGGSQGALSINDAFLNALKKESFSSIQVIHLAGAKNRILPLQQFYQNHNLPAYVTDFEPHMERIWPLVDLAICRAGAATLSELIHFRVPSLLIPYPYATDDHQKKNALFMEKIGAAQSLENLDLLAPFLKDLLQPPYIKLQEMRTALQGYQKKEPSDKLYTLILRTLKPEF
jgi:UDP-N-acetylglucosamine--N-acetylmuramyl-(pentapeptide) pyrophosphoryl-undecaprenol N-acetylglucosamine transferase